MANNPLKTNPLGQIADGVVEQVKDAAATTAKAAISEPAKILEQILGGTPVSTDVEQGNPTQAQQQAKQQADAAAMQQRQQDAQAKAAEAYKLHQQKLQEEINFYQQRKQEEAAKQQAEVRQEAEKQQIVQLQKEQESDQAWQQQIKAVQGSHEGQQGKF